MRKRGKKKEAQSEIFAMIDHAREKEAVAVPY